MHNKSALYLTIDRSKRTRLSLDRVNTFGIHALSSSVM